MATFYWVGGETAAGLARYDFNTAANWNYKYWDPNTTGSSNGWKFGGATNAPGHGSIVQVGYSSIYEPLDPPTCKAPLLFGGFSGNVGYGEWLNALGPTGTTLTSSLEKFVYVRDEYVRYPFPYVGGGMTGAVYNWAITTQGVNPDLFNSAIGVRAVQPLNLKVSADLSVIEVDEADYSQHINIHSVKSLSTIVGVSGQYVRTKADIANNFGEIALDGGSFDEMYYQGYTPTSHFTLSSANVGFFTANTAPMMLEDTCNVGYGNIGGSRFVGGEIWIGANADYLAVYKDLGYAITATSQQGPDASSWNLHPTCDYGNPGATSAGQPTIYFGLPTTNQSTPFYCKKLNVESRNCTTWEGPTELADKWNVLFAGGVSADNVQLINSEMGASEEISTSVKVVISTIDMREHSVLDFTKNSSFDNWFFGSITGGQINGGIVFRDETAKVLGSNGMRLFNTQLLAGRIDTHTGRPASTNSGFPTAID